jgi:hypothetical protein
MGGQKATNTVHYSLRVGGNTLVEDEREVTPEGNEQQYHDFDTHPKIGPIKSLGCI